MKSARLSRSLLLCSTALGLAAALPAAAETVTWAIWSNSTSGNPGSATGSIALGSGNTVTYSGQTSGLLVDYPSWTPVSSYSGGTVSNAPPSANNAVALEGGSSLVETITFSQAIANPVMAIWSLGAPGDLASFDFTSSVPFTLQAGGPDAEYGGSSIYASGNSVFGQEGNGVIQFTGTYSSLSFTTPTYEGYYAFTVGADGLAPPTPPTPPVTTVTPEPASLALLGSGLLGSLGMLRRRFLA